ncbi:MAG TPA: hypothetical protein VF600_06330 [Abditibacteriaceae bacterium]
MQTVVEANATERVLMSTRSVAFENRRNVIERDLQSMSVAGCFSGGANRK